MSTILTVHVPNIETFEAYDYGYGTVLDAVPDGRGYLIVTIDYGDDTFHAEYQMGRFHSGLYNASIERI